MTTHADLPIPADSYIAAPSVETAALFSTDGRVFYDLTALRESALHAIIMPGVIEVSMMPENDETRQRAAYYLGITEFVSSMAEQEDGLRAAFEANMPTA